MPKKSLGQNFLRDENILKKIVDFAHIQKTDVVLEIGPGEGTLTKFLLEKAKKVIVVEKDKVLTLNLKEKFKKEVSEDKLQIVNADILEIEKSKEFGELEIDNYILVGNIPYYITGEVFRKFLQNPPFDKQPTSITFVVQKEVAERIIGSHFAKALRDKKESILSISVKVYGNPESGGVIKAGSFFPAPKVDSAIIAIRDISKKRFEEITPLTLKGEPDTDTKQIEEKFFEILRSGFAHKRKFLIRNLETVAKKEKLKEVFDRLNLSEKERAEDLKLEDWFNLTREIL